MTRKYIGVFLLAITGCWSCNKFVDTPVPANQITPGAVFSSDGSATAALLGAYYSVGNTAGSVYLYGAFFSDELIFSGASGVSDQAMSNTYDNTSDYQFFTNFYKTIYNCNAILEALAKKNTLSDSVALLLRGECKFLRAYSHFRLMNFYGSIPLITTTNVDVTAHIGNTPVPQLYDTIVSDLKDAYAILPIAYPTADRVRANKWAAGALLARVYLYRKDWQDAETIAGQVISSGVYTLPADLNTVFQKGSTETIWQMWQQNGFTTPGGTWLPTSATAISYYVRPGLLSAIASGDRRLSAWLKAGTGANSNLFYPYKYKLRTTTTGATSENLVELRLAEQYLLRAEARANQGNVGDGLADVNTIRKRAGLADTTVADAAGLLLTIEQQRRIEFMLEDGQRWFDLNRTGRTGYWLSAAKSTWQARDTLLPFPLTILLANPALKQNPGY